MPNSLVRLSACLPVCLSACLPVCLSACLIFLVGLVGFADVAAAQQNWEDTPAEVRYVNPQGQGTPVNGMNWAQGFRSLDDALDPAVNVELVSLVQTYGVAWMELRIKEGFYVPQNTLPAGSPDPRRATFYLHPSVQRLWGGWAGTESLSELPIGKTTTLSGNIGQDYLVEDNSYHVVTVLPVQGDPPQWLKNLTVQDGYADGDTAIGVDQYGGGILVLSGHCRLVDVTVRACHAVFGGGAAVRKSSPEAPAVQLHARRSTFESNSAGQEGGGLWTSGSTRFVLVNPLFRSNVAATHGAGLFYGSENRISHIHNGVFHDNVAEGAGGAIFVADPNPALTPASNFWGPQLVNCTIAYNGAGDVGGAGIYVAHEDQNLFGGQPSSTTLICNSILYANPGASNDDNLYLEVPSTGVHSVDVSNSFLGPRRPDQMSPPNGQIDRVFGVSGFQSLGFIDAGLSGEIPGWTNPAARAFTLKYDSRCIDQGTDDVFTNSRGQDWTDIDGDDRFAGAFLGTEPLPREHFMGDDAFQGPNDTTREVKVLGAGTTALPQIGMDGGAVIGRITDIGAFEHRVYAAGPPQGP